jgi:hypothetical protein
VHDLRIGIGTQDKEGIKKDEKEGGILEFGTEVINTDGSLAVY